MLREVCLRGSVSGSDLEHLCVCWLPLAGFELEKWWPWVVFCSLIVPEARPIPGYSGGSGVGKEASPLRNIYGFGVREASRE